MTAGPARTWVAGRCRSACLGELAEHLIAVHGQNDQLRLLRPAEQRAVLDRFAGSPVTAPLAEYRALREEWLRVIAELAERTERSREMAREADLLKHGLTEIAAVAPKPDEDVELIEEAKRLGDVDQLRAAATAAQFAVTGSPDGDTEVPGALGLVDAARRQVAATDDPAADLALPPAGRGGRAARRRRRRADRVPGRPWPPIRRGWSRCWRGRPS